MSLLVAWWNRVWFAPSTPTHLAVARIFFYGFLAIRATELDSHVWAEYAVVAWKPITFYKYLGPVPSASVLRWMDVAFIASLLMSAAGLLSRISMPSAAVLGLYLYGLQNNFYKVNHGYAVVIFIMTFFALSRAGDVWSIDADIRRRLGKGPAPALSGEYTWPIRVVWLILALVYCCAGISKMQESGLDWALTDNLKRLLIRHQYSHEPPTMLGPVVAGMGPLPKVLAILSLGLELGAPLALVHRYLRYAIGLGLFGMQLGIWLMMGVRFEGNLVALFVFWAPWGEWIDRLREIAGGRIPPAAPRKMADPPAAA